MAGLILPPAPRGARAGTFSDYLKRQQYARDASMSWFYTHLMPPRPSSVCVLPLLLRVTAAYRRWLYKF